MGECIIVCGGECIVCVCSGDFRVHKQGGASQHAPLEMFWNFECLRCTVRPF